MVQQETRLHGLLCLPVTRSWEQGQPQVDHSGIQGEGLVLQPQRPAGSYHPPISCQQVAEEISADLPRPELVGMGSGNHLGETWIPRPLFFPSTDRSPTQISRSECACPTCKKSIATNYRQQVNPLAPLSALCAFTMPSNITLGNTRGVVRTDSLPLS